MKEYKTTEDILKRVGVSRQRVHQVFDYYNLAFPEPDAVVGKRRLYLPETVETFAENFPTRKTIFYLVEKWKAENPGFISSPDFIRGKGVAIQERKAFLAKISSLTSAGKITNKQYGKFRIYKIEELSEIYDKTYADVLSFTISKFADEFAKNPTATTLEQFAETTGLSFTRVLYRKNCSNPRPAPVFRVAGKHFYNHEDLIKTLTIKDLKEIKAIAESKMSEGADSV